MSVSSPKKQHKKYSQKLMNNQITEPQIMVALTSDITLDMLSEKLQESHKISRMAIGSPRMAGCADKLRISSELLQDLILKLLLADAQGIGLKISDTVHLARALKEIANLHDKLASADDGENFTEKQQKATKNAMRALGLLNAETLENAATPLGKETSS